MARVKQTARKSTKKEKKKEAAKPRRTRNTKRKSSLLQLGNTGTVIEKQPKDGPALDPGKFVIQSPPSKRRLPTNNVARKPSPNSQSPEEEETPTPIPFRQKYSKALKSMPSDSSDDDDDELKLPAKEEAPKAADVECLSSENESELKLPAKEEAPKAADVECLSSENESDSVASFLLELKESVENNNSSSNIDAPLVGPFDFCTLNIMCSNYKFDSALTGREKWKQWMTVLGRKSRDMLKGDDKEQELIIVFHDGSESKFANMSSTPDDSEWSPRAVLYRRRISTTVIMVMTELDCRPFGYNSLTEVDFDLTSFGPFTDELRFYMDRTWYELGFRDGEEVDRRVALILVRPRERDADGNLVEFQPAMDLPDVEPPVEVLAGEKRPRENQEPSNLNDAAGGAAGGAGGDGGSQSGGGDDEDSVGEDGEGPGGGEGSGGADGSGGGDGEGPGDKSDDVYESEEEESEDDDTEASESSEEGQPTQLQLTAPAVQYIPPQGRKAGLMPGKKGRKAGVMLGKKNSAKSSKPDMRRLQKLLDEFVAIRGHHIAVVVNTVAGHTDHPPFVVDGRNPGYSELFDVKLQDTDLHNVCYLLYTGMCERSLREVFNFEKAAKVPFNSLSLPPLVSPVVTRFGTYTDEDGATKSVAVQRDPVVGAPNQVKHFRKYNLCCWNYFSSVAVVDHLERRYVALQHEMGVESPEKLGLELRFISLCNFQLLLERTPEARDHMAKLLRSHFHHLWIGNLKPIRKQDVFFRFINTLHSQNRVRVTPSPSMAFWQLQKLVHQIHLQCNGKVGTPYALLNRKPLLDSNATWDDVLKRAITVLQSRADVYDIIPQLTEIYLQKNGVVLKLDKDALGHIVWIRREKNGSVVIEDLTTRNARFARVFPCPPPLSNGFFEVLVQGD